MYFVPVRKLLKLLFVRSVSTKRERTPLTLHESLNTGPDSRRRYCRRWLLVFLVTLVCLYILIYCKSVQDMSARRQHASTNSNMIGNRRKGHVAKKTHPNLDHGNVVDVDIFNHHNENVKESNIINNTTARMTTVAYHKTDTSKNNSDVSTTENNANEEATRFIGTNNELPICGPMVGQNDVKGQRKIQRITDNLFSEVRPGGYFSPSKCRSRHKVAILVPYRNRERNLAVFTYHMHPFLMKQQLEYRIFIIEQNGGELFNRGKLFNIGFTEMMKYNDWHCVVLHDVDLLPESDKILYTCPTFPRHMCGTVVEKAKLTYNQYHTLFGGVSALSVQHYKQINGFSNLYWGWGGEDNDMYWRILSSRILMVRYNKTIARYKSLPHPKQGKNNRRYQLLKFTVARYKEDGLSSLVYRVVWTKYRHLYTHILADVNPLKENITDVYSKLFG